MLLGMLIGSFTSLSAAEAEHWNGDLKAYFRTGMTEGMNPDRSFKLPGALSKYRLGNEFEQYLEAFLKQDLARFGDGSIVSATLGGVFNHPYGVHSYTNGEGSTRLPEVLLGWRNLPWLNGGAIIAGRMVYLKQADVHINDFFYRNMASGLGAGVQDVQLGKLKATWFLSRKDKLSQEYYVNRNDLLIEGIDTNTGGSLEFGLNHVEKDKHRAGTSWGWAAHVRHQQKIGEQSKNNLVLQYGEGPGTGLGFTGDVFLNRDNNRWRIVEAYEWQGERLGGQVTGIWQRDRFANGATQDWISVGGRASYGVSDRIKLTLEIGHDEVNPSGAARRSMTKYTFAPSFSPKGTGFWSRPDIRIFYTWAQWNGAAQRAADFVAPGTALSSSGAFGTSRHGGNFGIQIEFWGGYTPTKRIIKYMGW